MHSTQAYLSVISHSPCNLVLSFSLSSCSPLSLLECLSCHHSSKKPFSSAYQRATAFWLSLMCACRQPMEHALTDSQPTGTRAQQLPSEPETPRSSRIGPDVPSEDTGQPLSLCEPVDTSTSVVEDLNSEMKATSEVRMTPPPSHPIHSMDNNVSKFSC